MTPQKPKRDTPPKMAQKEEKTTDWKNPEERAEEKLTQNSGFWKWILSRFRRWRSQKPNASSEQENGLPESSSTVEKNPEPGTVGACLSTHPEQLSPSESSESTFDGGTEEPEVPENSERDVTKEVKTREQGSEGYGSFYMPCCPCAGHLDDQPCMPQWCFSYKYLDWMTVVALITCFCWGTAYSVDPATASFQGAVFTLAAVTILAYAAGHASAYFISLPPTLFMFVVGFAFRNSPVWKYSSHFEDSTVEATKAFLMTIMATKAALYFDVKIFLKYPLTILLLGIVPCVCEISAVGGVLYAISGLDLDTAFTTATVLANVSTVVISHSLVTLAKAGYGAQTGIISILMAAAPIDGMIVLTLLGVLVVDNKSGITKVLMTLAGQFAGIVLGGLTGAFLAFFPNRNNVNATLQRTVLHILFIMCVLLICHTLDVMSVGHLFNTAAACATVNCMGMKKWTIEVMMLKDIFEMIWHVLQPFTVVLVCCIVDFSELNSAMIWQSFVVFSVSYVVRVCLVILSTQFSGKPIKQRIFMSLCWTARGLTQGIMAGTLIGYVSTTSTPQQTRDVLTIFTVDLIAGNVIGALQIWFLGPKLLPRNELLSNA